MRRIILFNLLLIIVLFGGGGGLLYYFYESKYFISTDDAMVQGDVISISSPITGQLTSWDAKTGNTYSSKQALGTVGVVDAQTISTPAQGTLVTNNVVQGETVTQGETLGQEVDLNNLYIIAYIDESDISNVEVGKDVDISIDAFSGNTYKGTVLEVGNATSSVFSIMPQNNAFGSYTKSTQRIPVKISLTNYSKGMIPGLNATVKIHR